MAYFCGFISANIINYYNILDVNNLKRTYYIVVIFLMCFLSIVNAQNSVKKPMQNNSNISDTIIVPVDTLSSNFSTSVPKDFFKARFGTDSTGSNRDTLNQENSDYKISKDALDGEVNYEARDSSWVDLEHDKIHLYGGAKVEYQNIKLTANYMVIDFSNNTIEGFQNKEGITAGQEKPTFSEGENTLPIKNKVYLNRKKGWLTML
ncbi:MAG: hypothetical protein IPO98_11290 [Saprospiraceae bacterium]|nr:hypothetical protein [Saprospiraceae bacterium]